MTLSVEEKQKRHQERRQRKYDETHKTINNEIYKMCSVCDEWLPCTEEYFYKNKSNGIDGMHPWCKKCSISKNLDRYYNDGGLTKLKTIEKAKIRYKTNNDDKKIKIANGKKQRETGYFKNWQKQNPEKLKKYALEREMNHTHQITNIEWMNCKEYFNYECAYCGLPIDEHYNKYKGEIKLTDLHKEHVFHRGSNGIENCIPSCKHCNSSKHTEDMETWYRKQEFFSELRLHKILKWITEDNKFYINICYNKS